MKYRGRSYIIEERQGRIWYSFDFGDTWAPTLYEAFSRAFPQGNPKEEAAIPEYWLQARTMVHERAGMNHRDALAQAVDDWYTQGKFQEAMEVELGGPEKKWKCSRCGSEHADKPRTEDELQAREVAARHRMGLCAECGVPVIDMPRNPEGEYEHVRIKSSAALRRRGKTKYRSIRTPTGKVLRIAFPPGRRRKGSGELQSILYPENPPPRKIYQRCVEIIASKAGMPHQCDAACKRAGHMYRHKFSKQACIYGLHDGNVLVGRL